MQPEHRRPSRPVIGSRRRAVDFVMSVRGIGEGHRSSIGFRTGTVSADGAVIVDEPGRFPTLATVESPVFDRDAFAGRLRATRRATARTPTYVLDHLGRHVQRSTSSSRRLGVLARTARHPALTRTRPRRCCGRSRPAATTPRFSADTAHLRAGAVARHGGRGATAWRTHGSSGSSTTTARSPTTPPTPPSTASSISQQLLRTTDFLELRRLADDRARPPTNKGLALFPRRIGGRFVALSRHDRETNAVAFSDIARRTGTTPSPSRCPDRDWEVIQLGNCGSPIETDEGWLVLTHGVGPMRTYSIGALLLDLDDPTEVIATLPEPLLTPRRRAGRLRPERRLLVRCPAARRDPRDPLRRRRHLHRHRHRPVAGPARRNGPDRVSAS